MTTNDGIYGCDACRTTAGRSGCPTHRDRPSVGANMFYTTCLHGVDLRFTPRCYLCKPEPTYGEIVRLRAIEHAARAAMRAGWFTTNDEGDRAAEALREALGLER